MSQAAAVREVIYGRTIELTQDPGLDEGQQVEVVLRSVATEMVWGEGIRKSAGGWSKEPELAQIMEQVHAERRRDRSH